MGQMGKLHATCGNLLKIPINVSYSVQKQKLRISTINSEEAAAGEQLNIQQQHAASLSCTEAASHQETCAVALGSKPACNTSSWSLQTPASSSSSLFPLLLNSHIDIYVIVAPDALPAFNCLSGMNKVFGILNLHFGPTVTSQLCQFEILKLVLSQICSHT